LIESHYEHVYGAAVARLNDIADCGHPAGRDRAP
jgi:hypothetical protein